MNQDEFIKNIRYSCEEIRNRFPSERIKVSDVDPKLPWWFSKIEEIEENCKKQLTGEYDSVKWTRYYP